MQGVFVILTKWHQGQTFIIAKPATQEGTIEIYKELKQILSNLTMEEHSHTYITPLMNDASIVIFVHCLPFREQD
jgi:hypothetical protein